MGLGVWQQPRQPDRRIWHSNLSTGAAANFPGSRWGAVGWSDATSNLWFYGGWGYGSVTTDPTGFLDDIWEFQHSTGQWIWWKGTPNVNQNGQYLTNGLPFVQNVAGARRGAAIWQPDPSGYVWIFGGEGYDSTHGTPRDTSTICGRICRSLTDGTNGNGFLNDLWRYVPYP